MVPVDRRSIVWKSIRAVVSLNRFPRLSTRESSTTRNEYQAIGCKRCPGRDDDLRRRARRDVQRHRRASCCPATGRPRAPGQGQQAVPNSTANGVPTGMPRELSVIPRTCTFTFSGIRHSRSREIDDCSAQSPSHCRSGPRSRRSSCDTCVCCPTDRSVRSQGALNSPCRVYAHRCGAVQDSRCRRREQVARYDR